MKLSILLIGVFIFIVCLLIHIVIWRRWHPKRKVVVLLLLFILSPFLFITGYRGLEWFGFVPSIISFTTADWLAIYLLHFALSFAYISSYPAVEAASPSLAILLMIRDSIPHGVVYDDLLHVFDDGIVLEPRLKDLIEAGFIAESNGYFMVTHRGVTFVRCFMLLRRLLGLPIGKG